MGADGAEQIKQHYIEEQYSKYVQDIGQLLEGDEGLVEKKHNYNQDRLQLRRESSEDGAPSTSATEPDEQNIEEVQGL